jgi:hypothetical protein
MGVQVVAKDHPKLKRYLLSVIVDHANEKIGKVQLDNLRLTVEKFNAALKVEEFDHKHKDILFDIQGRMLMESICKAPSSSLDVGYVHWQAKTKTIRLYGNEQQKEKIKLNFLTHIQDVLETPLETFYVKKHQTKKALQNEYNIRRLTGVYHFKVSSQRVELKATAAGLSKLKGVLSGQKIELQQSRPPALTKELISVDTKGDCPVCLCELESPQMLSCGHQYCKMCLCNKIQSAANGGGGDIPLKCDNEGCGKAFVWRDIETNASSQVSMCFELFRRAFHIFI